MRRHVMVIDYANVESNPRLVIRSIRDELVEVGSLPARGAPISEAKFLACAEGARKFAASKAAS